MTTPGIRASALILKLQKLIEQHGDRMVYAGGADYPGGVGGVTVNKRDDGYVPKDHFLIWTHSA